MARPFIVKLDTLYGRDDEIELVRSVDESYEKSTFRSLVEHMIGPEPDDSNDDYNASEKDLAERINGWLQEAKQSSNVSVSIKALSNTGKLVDGISLDDNINNYSSEIMLEGSENIDGRDVPYRNMELYIRKDNGGGLLCNYITF